MKDAMKLLIRAIFEVYDIDEDATPEDVEFLVSWYYHNYVLAVQELMEQPPRVRMPRSAPFPHTTAIDFHTHWLNRLIPNQCVVLTWELVSHDLPFQWREHLSHVGALYLMYGAQVVKEGLGGHPEDQPWHGWQPEK